MAAARGSAQTKQGSNCLRYASEAMSAEERSLFEETLAEDEAALQALLKQAKGTPVEDSAAFSKRKPRRRQTLGQLWAKSN